jgi:hypothetical protein
MATKKRRTVKKTARKKAATKRAALTRFTATQKVAARKDSDGSVWLLIGPISWLQRINRRPGEDRTRLAALKALRSFQKR